MLDQVFDAFVKESAVSVMFRGALENVFSSERLDAIFEQHARRQLSGELAFSSCAALLSLVTTRMQPSVHAAYLQNVQEVGVAIKSVYNKLNGVELAVSEALVRETAAGMRDIVQELNAELAGPLPGYDIRIVDGNHLGGAHHRLKELRSLGDAALPGHSLAVLNPHHELIESVIACEDGHANQKPLYLLLLDQVQPGQCWIADRDYSTLEFLFGFQPRNAYFLIRQHGALLGKLLGRRRRVGQTDTGIVYEQALQLTNRQGETLTMRRISVELTTPTRDGDLQIHVLTNLPEEIGACQVAGAYRGRWSIETAFAKLTQDLRCELNTLGYPKAALFSFCVAVVMFNVLSTVIAAMRVAHPQVATRQSQANGKERTFSFYYLADEISGVARGMAIAIPAEHWSQAFASLTPRQMAQELLRLARRVNVKRFLTNPYGSQARRKKPKTTSARHVSIHRILQQRNTKKTTAARQR